MGKRSDFFFNVLCYWIQLVERNEHVLRWVNSDWTFTLKQRGLIQKDIQLNLCNAFSILIFNKLCWFLLIKIRTGSSFFTFSTQNINLKVVVFNSVTRDIFLYKNQYFKKKKSKKRSLINQSILLHNFRIYAINEILLCIIRSDLVLFFHPARMLRYILFLLC